MATKRNDDKGYERGARGIDGRDGENFHPDRYPTGGKELACGKVTNDSGGLSGEKRSGSAMQRSAKGK